MEELIDRIFQNHYEYYSSLGVETMKQQASQYKQVEEAYQGRAVYELVQNAIDRAGEKILVRLIRSEQRNYLIVANDGSQFTFNSAYDYRDGGSKRYDFQSLCSIATSTKDAVKDIGNKGVGFKSVFSLNGYADVFTKGRVYPENCDADIDFRLYDMITTSEILDPIDSEIAKKLTSIAEEQTCWGIPGYYFPVRLDSRPEFIEELLAEGYVTAVCIELDESQIEDVSSKVDNLRKHQFYFIPEKESFRDKKTIRLNVACFDDKPPYCFEIKRSPRVISVPISDESRRLGLQAGVAVDENARVSIYLKDREGGENEYDRTTGMLYNFLPTEMDSMFSKIDFNADFHTSVDRKRIELTGGAIASYNRALLRDCLQLVKKALVDELLIDDDTFYWQLCEIKEHGADEYAEIFREVFFDDFPEYSLRLLQTRMKESTEANFNSFYRDYLIKAANQFYRYRNWSYSKERMGRFGDLLREKRIRFLPDTECASDIIFYRKDSSNLTLPRVIPAEFTSYWLDLDYQYNFVKNRLIRDFENTSEIYNRYWQCGYDGRVSSQSIDEDTQLDVLESVWNLMSIEKDGAPANACWRFDVLLRDSDDFRTRGAFALATLFYKTKKGRYLPGQMLRRDDIDDEFLRRLGERIGVENVDRLLLKTGVTLPRADAPKSNHYFFADRRIREAFGDGLDRIPSPDINVAIPRKELWANIRIYRVADRESRERSWIPALVNENYSIFDRLPRNRSNNKDFTSLLVGNYQAMPEPYYDFLRQHLEATVKDSMNHREIFRFYGKFYKELFKRNIVIVRQNGALRVTTMTDDVRVVDNDLVFSDNVKLNIPLVYTSIADADPFRDCRLNVNMTLDENLSEVMDDGPETDGNFIKEKVGEFLESVDKQMATLVKISNSSISEHDLENDSAARERFYKTLAALNPVYYTELCVKCHVGGNEIEIDDVPYIFDADSLSVKIDTTDLAWSRNNVSRALSVAAFHSEKFADIFELTIFSECFVSERDKNNMRPSAGSDDDAMFDSGNRLPVDDERRPIANEEPELTIIPNLNIEVNSLTLGEATATKFAGLTSKSDGEATTISRSQQATGYKGEHIVASHFALKFLADFPDRESRENAIGRINEFLRKNRFDEIIPENDGFDEACVLKALWYTRHGYKPFDIVTITKDGQVKLIEVKSTKGGSMFHFSKREIIFANTFRENYGICLMDTSCGRLTILENPFPKEPELTYEKGKLMPRGYDLIVDNH